MRRRTGSEAEILAWPAPGSRAEDPRARAMSLRFRGSSADTSLFSNETTATNRAPSEVPLRECPPTGRAGGPSFAMIDDARRTGRRIRGRVRCSSSVGVSHRRSCHLHGRQARGLFTPGHRRIGLVDQFLSTEAGSKEVLPKLLGPPPAPRRGVPSPLKNPLKNLG
jgi:hypothetical protein